MKRNTLLVAFLAFMTFVAQAQNDTMYVMKNGVVINKQSVKPADVDSVIFYKPILTTSNTVTDARDGKTYKTVKIGTQVWMAENLAYLPQVDTVTAGSEDVAAGKYYYVYDFAPKKGDSEQAQVTAAKATANYKTYGVLYNWNAAMNGATSSATNPSKVQGACPTGWHLPSDAEWTELTTYLGGKGVAGGKLKEAGSAHWDSPNIAATNEVGFTALPAGFRAVDSRFDYLPGGTFIWSSTEFNNADQAIYMGIYSNVAYIAFHYFVGKHFGNSVRCVRD